MAGKCLHEDLDFPGHHLDPIAFSQFFPLSLFLFSSVKLCRAGRKLDTVQEQYTAQTQLEIQELLSDNKLCFEARRNKHIFSLFIFIFKPRFIFNDPCVTDNRAMCSKHKVINKFSSGADCFTYGGHINVQLSFSVTTKFVSFLKATTGSLKNVFFNVPSTKYLGLSNQMATKKQLLNYFSSCAEMPAAGQL